jgi:citrate synthase
MTQKRTAKLTFDDGSPPIEFPMLSGTIGPDVVDIRALYNQTGKFTYDPGFMSTGSVQIGDHLHRWR